MASSKTFFGFWLFILITLNVSWYLLREKRGFSLHRWRFDGRLKKLRNHRKYEDIAREYCAQARRQSKMYLQDNDNGYAALYRHDSSIAIQYFRSARAGAIGSMLNEIHNNLAIAYLQGGWSEHALDLLEEIRGKGNVHIVTYLLALLANGKHEDARKFYANHDLHSPAQGSIELLLALSAGDVSNAITLQETLDDCHLWLYQPVIKRMIEYYELESFFSRPNRYDVLYQQGRAILTALDATPLLFSSPKVRHVRFILQMVLPQTQNYYGVAGLFGVIWGLDSLMKELPLDEDIVGNCILFWKRLYMIHGRTRSFEYYDASIERDRYKSQLATDVQAVIRGSERCGVMFSATLEWGVRYERVVHPGGKFLYLDYVSHSFVEEVEVATKPVICVLEVDSTMEKLLEPLLFRLVCYPETITLSQVQDVVMQLPMTYREQMEPLVQHLESVSNTI